MNVPFGRCSRCRVVAGLLLAVFSLSACSDKAIIGGTIGATVLGANAPTQEIQQIYYLGAFDPQGQLPPTVYRIRLHGQASFISFMRFASGWVPAKFIDSLASDVRFGEGKSGRVQIDEAASDRLSELSTGRRLMQFGPEGFREAPAGHRLVVVMGTSPEDFFESIDASLGAIAEARAERRDNALDRKLFETLSALRDERDDLTVLDRKIDADLAPNKESRS